MSEDIKKLQKEADMARNIIEKAAIMDKIKKLKEEQKKQSTPEVVKEFVPTKDAAAVADHGKYTNPSWNNRIRLM